MRETSDYDPFSFYDEEDAEEAVNDAERFLRKMKELFDHLKGYGRGS